jgi:hypothetical protein
MFAVSSCGNDAASEPFLHLHWSAPVHGMVSYLGHLLIGRWLRDALDWSPGHLLKGTAGRLMCFHCILPVVTLLQNFVQALTVVRFVGLFCRTGADLLRRGAL